MIYKFLLPDFPNAEFGLETSIWSGKSKLYMDDKPLEQLKEKGTPFLIPTADGGVVKAYTRPALPDIIPVLEIDGVKYRIVEKLQWYQYALGALPILLVIVGGAIGGVFGAVGVVTNYNIFRGEGSETSKYLKVIGIVVAMYALYFVIATFVLKMLH